MMQKVARIGREHYDKDTKLETWLDYFECPVCFMLQEDFLECSKCTSRACKACAIDFSKKEHEKDPSAKGKGIYKCTICHGVLPHKTMHRFLAKLLMELKFRCDDCKKVYAYAVIKQHKQRGECHRAIAGAQDEDSHMVDSFAQPNAAVGAELIKSLFVFERDSKFIHEYVFQTRTLTKYPVQMATNFPHNFQSVQMPGGRLFLIGGGDFNKNPDSLYECYELVSIDGTYNILSKDKMKYPRHGHAACSLSDKFIVVTGSRKENDQAHVKAECYNVDIDIWFDLPALNEGRHYHASCSFLDRFVYVFCGISNATKKYINSIERFDNSNKKAWELITF